MKNEISNEVLSALAPKLQGMTSEPELLLNKSFSLADVLVSADADADLSNANAKDNGRVRLLYKSSDKKMFTFPIRSFINIDVLKTKTSKTSNKMYESLQPVTPKSAKYKFPNFKVTKVEDSLDNGNKIYPLWNYVLFTENQSAFYGKNPDAQPSEFYDAHPQLRSQCVTDGRIIDDTKNFKDITVVFE